MFSPMGGRHFTSLTTGSGPFRKGIVHKVAVEGQATMS